MELKEGMCVRYENGISKYLGLGKDVLTNDESNQFKHYANQHLFDRNIFDVGHDWGDTLSDEEFKNIDEYIEKESSDNIIDLIEIRDYVNGEKVMVISEFKDGSRYIEFDEGRYLCKSEDIKSIVTKEQFNSAKYEVE